MNEQLYSVMYKGIVTESLVVKTLAAVTKVVPIIKCTCTVFIDNFRDISTNSLI